MVFNPELGDLILYHGSNKLISKGIKFITRSRYSHVGIYVGDGVIAEALDEGFIKTTNLDLSMATTVDVYRLKEGQFDQERLNAITELFLGRKYSWFDILKLLIYELTGKQIYKTRTKNLICSEAVMRVYENYGFDLFPNKLKDYITPQDISLNYKLFCVRCTSESK